MSSILDIAGDFHQQTYKAAKAPKRGRGSGSHWRKYRSRSAGCHPSQVAEFNERLKKEGVTGAYYDKDGSMVATSRQGQKNFCKSSGMTNFDDYF